MSRYYDAIRANLRARSPVPPPVSLENVEAFIKDNAEKYNVQWLEGVEEPAHATT